MGLFGRDKNQGKAIQHLNVSYFSGIPDYIVDAALVLTLQEDKLLVRSLVYKLPPASIKYTQIKNVGLTKGSYIVEQDNNVAERAVVGGLLFGGLGAIIGGMSGVGGKKRLNGEFLIINYKPIDSESVKVLSFQIVGASIGKKKFSDELCRRANIEVTKYEAAQDEIKL